MPFKFRLKSLKKHREFLFREAQAALGAALSLKMRIESHIERLNETIRLESELFEREQEKGIETARYLHFKAHLNFLERELLLSCRELEKAVVEVETRKLTVIECDKSVKTLENIETRDRKLYRSIQYRKEQKKLDDVGIFSTWQPMVSPTVYPDRNGEEKENHERR